MVTVFVYFLGHLNSASYPNELKWILAILLPPTGFCMHHDIKLMVIANINAGILEAAC